MIGFPWFGVRGLERKSLRAGRLEFVLDEFPQRGMCGLMGHQLMSTVFNLQGLASGVGAQQLEFAGLLVGIQGWISMVWRPRVGISGLAQSAWAHGQSVDACETCRVGHLGLERNSLNLIGLQWFGVRGLEPKV